MNRNKKVRKMSLKITECTEMDLIVSAIDLDELIKQRFCEVLEVAKRTWESLKHDELMGAWDLLETLKEESHIIIDNWIRAITLRIVQRKDEKENELYNSCFDETGKFLVENAKAILKQQKEKEQ